MPAEDPEHGYLINEDVDQMLAEPDGPCVALTFAVQLIEALAEASPGPTQERLCRRMATTLRAVLMLHRPDMLRQLDLTLSECRAEALAKEMEPHG